MARAFAAAVITILATAAVMLRGAEAAVNCDHVSSALIPCLSYLRGRGDYAPSESCCNGVNDVKAMVRSTSDRREACECVKRAANRYTDLKEGLASGLSGKCGVQINFPISRTVDCSRI